MHLRRTVPQKEGITFGIKLAKAKNSITLTIGGPCFTAPNEKGNTVLDVLSADQPRFEREADPGEKNREVVLIELDQGRASLFVHCLDT